MVVDHARCSIVLSFLSKDGRAHNARMWIDSGNPDWIISERFAESLGLDISDPSVENELWGNVHLAEIPQARIGKMKLDIENVPAVIPVGQGPVFPGLAVEGNVPSTLLAKYDVVLDYSKSKFTFGRQGTLKPKGRRVEGKVNSKTGILDVESNIAGIRCNLALDNGASFTLIDEELIGKVTSVKPGIPQIKGAIGLANMFGAQRERNAALYQIPEVEWGAAGFKQVGCMAMPPSFSEWYSKKTARQVGGLIGGNVLRDYRVQVNFKDQTVFLEERGSRRPHDMDMVGLALRPQPDGKFIVVDKAGGQGSPPEVEIRDGLVAIGNVELQGLTLGDAVDLLRGRPGRKRRLRLSRGERELEVRAEVVRHW